MFLIQHGLEIFFTSDANFQKGITSTELSRKLDLRQKTCWAFKRKVMKAMKSSGNYPITGDAEVDETVFGGQEEVRAVERTQKRDLL